MPHQKQVLGRWGEQLAADYFSQQGYIILARNEHTPHGEIDLIVQSDEQPTSTIVFVEVKARSTTLFGPPEEAVNWRKQAHLRAAIAYYMQHHPQTDMDWRVDVIAIEKFSDGTEPRLTHFENALKG